MVINDGSPNDGIVEASRSGRPIQAAERHWIGHYLVKEGRVVISDGLPNDGTATLGDPPEGGWFRKGEG